MRKKRLLPGKLLLLRAAGSRRGGSRMNYFGDQGSGEGGKAAKFHSDDNTIFASVCVPVIIGSWPAVEALASVMGDAMHQPNSNGDTPLHLAAERNAVRLTAVRPQPNSRHHLLPPPALHIAYARSARCSNAENHKPHRQIQSAVILGMWRFTRAFCPGGVYVLADRSYSRQARILLRPTRQGDAPSIGHTQRSHTQLSAMLSNLMRTNDESRPSPLAPPS